MKYLLEIAYDGANYKGWQFQKNEKTIQGTLEEKIKIILRKSNLKLYVAGRTDAGVHAEKQYAHFEIEKELKIEKIRHGINALLKNESIVIKNIEQVPNDFHARFSCVNKEYRYQILVGHIHNIFLNNRYWLVPKFNIQKAQEIANLLIGTHDFTSFRDSQCQAKSPIRSINTCKFEEYDNLITMKIQAKSFLHHQIRIIIGTIFEIIIKQEPINKILDILNKKDRKHAGITAPAKGLFLINVEY